MSWFLAGFAFGMLIIGPIVGSYIVEWRNNK